MYSSYQSKSGYNFGCCKYNPCQVLYALVLLEWLDLQSLFVNLYICHCVATNHYRIFQMSDFISVRSDAHLTILNGCRPSTYLNLYAQ